MQMKTNHWGRLANPIGRRYSGIPTSLGVLALSLLLLACSGTKETQNSESDNPRPGQDDDDACDESPILFCDEDAAIWEIYCGELATEPREVCELDCFEDNGEAFCCEEEARLVCDAGRPAVRNACGQIEEYLEECSQYEVCSNGECIEDVCRVRIDLQSSNTCNGVETARISLNWPSQPLMYVEHGDVVEISGYYSTHTAYCEGHTRSGQGFHYHTSSNNSYTFTCDEGEDVFSHVCYDDTNY